MRYDPWGDLQDSIGVGLEVVVEIVVTDKNTSRPLKAYASCNMLQSSAHAHGNQ